MGLQHAKAELADSRFADIRWTAETGSTNTDAMAILDENRRRKPASPKAVVVVADHQSAGRGRLDRSWESASADSLLVSVGTTTEIDVNLRGLLLTAAGLGAVSACEDTTGYRPKLKWPNDIVAPGSGTDGADLKLGGILAEAQPADGLTATVVGIGLNCNWERAPEGLESIAISLKQLTGQAVDRTELLVALVKSFETNLEFLESGSATELLIRARAESATLGREIRVTTPDSQLEGKAVDIDSEGALIVEDDSGESHRVVVGDVIHARPAD